jgi:hypothetical protein
MGRFLVRHNLDDRLIQQPVLLAGSVEPGVVEKILRAAEAGSIGEEKEPRFPAPW